VACWSDLQEKCKETFDDIFDHYVYHLVADRREHVRIRFRQTTCESYKDFLGQSSSQIAYLLRKTLIKAVARTTC
jgi:hypothetical protein